MEKYMPPAPWTINIEDGGMEIVCDDFAVCQMRFYGPEERAIAAIEANAIVTAVNNTYGNNINPEAVKDLLEACEAAARYLDKTGQNDELYQKLTKAASDAKL